MADEPKEPKKEKEEELEEFLRNPAKHRPRTPREFIHERMRELEKESGKEDKKE